MTSKFIAYLNGIIESLSYGLKVDLKLLESDLNDPVLLSMQSFGIEEGMKRVLLPIAESANYKAVIHPDWSLLAGRLEIERLKMLVPKTLLEMINIKPEIWRNDDNCDYLDFVRHHSQELEAMIVPERDYDLYFFGVRTLEKSYLTKIDDNQFLETPQRMYLRIATFLWMPNLPKINEYYNLMSRGYFTHASPTMFNSGLKNGALASCYLLSIQDDLEKIFKCLGQCAMISKAAGGIGLDITNIRHSSVGHTGQSSGIVPMLKVYDASMRYVDQGGRRKGAATIFLQPWHIDFPDFLLLKRQHGKEENRARDLFYAVWNCDIFMRRVREDKNWTLFCPKSVPKLKDTFGKEFDNWYLQYEKMDIPKKVMPARELWAELITTQIETGMPFMTNKDTANYTSNQKNLGLIRSSNLCVEIMEVTDENTISSCNLASISLDEFVTNNGTVFDHKHLGYVVRQIVNGLNRVIDRTCYPLSTSSEAGPIKTTNLKYRPLGIGVQALADTFLKMGMAWTDPAARELNKEIFATIYYHAIDESANMASIFGSYDGFEKSPASNGILKFDLISSELERKKGKEAPLELSPMYDWAALKEKAALGLRNSLLVALMPTAASAQIRYKNESFEPFTTNIYTRSVLSGNHLIVNRYLVQDLEEMGLWNKTVIDFILSRDGSIAELPEGLVRTEDGKAKLARLKEKYLTSFEISQKLLVDMAIDRSIYVCQSQSLNIYYKNPDHRKLSSLHFYAWENALSTGMYYLRTAAATEAIKFTIDAPSMKICTDEVCISCQS